MTSIGHESTNPNGIPAVERTPRDRKWAPPAALEMLWKMGHDRATDEYPRESGRSPARCRTHQMFGACSVHLLWWSWIAARLLPALAIASPTAGDGATLLRVGTAGTPTGCAGGLLPCMAGGSGSIPGRGAIGVASRPSPRRSPGRCRNIVKRCTALTTTRPRLVTGTT